MSLFLGKIHFWLFAKIQWFEGLEQEVLNFAECKNLPVKQWKDEVYKKYGYPTPDRPLEEIIDKDNIHAWLQTRIVLAEERSADFITRILKSNLEYKSGLMKVYREEGIKNADTYKKSKETPQSPAEMYGAMNDYVLEGMPCDRINEILFKDESRIEWETTECIHKDYWNNKGGDVKNFYELRDSWLETFINEVNKDFHFEIVNHTIRAIVRGR